jgi:hypothetical protein
LGRSTARVFEVAIRFHLGLVSTESKGFYQEVEDIPGGGGVRPLEAVW